MKVWILIVMVLGLFVSACSGGPNAMAPSKSAPLTFELSDCRTASSTVAILDKCKD